MSQSEPDGINSDQNEPKWTQFGPKMNPNGPDWIGIDPNEPEGVSDGPKWTPNELQ